MHQITNLTTEEFLSLASQKASHNVENGGGPFYAFIVGNNQIFESGNRVTIDNDPTAHAEVSVIRKACKKLETFNLTGYILYSSCEPCPMCLGASMWANLDTVYFNANRHDAEQADFRDALFYEKFKNNANNEDSNTNQENFVRALRTENAFLPFQTWLDKQDKTEY